MMLPNNLRIKCACGQVAATVTEITPAFTVCHCKTCRTWGGGPFFAVECGHGVKFDCMDAIKEYPSSDWATRGFCKHCGTHLFYRLNKTQTYNMTLGLFDDVEGLQMAMQYFSDEKPAYYCFSNETKTMTAAEIAAYFASKLSED